MSDNKNQEYYDLFDGHMHSAAYRKQAIDAVVAAVKEDLIDDLHEGIRAVDREAEKRGRADERRKCAEIVRDKIRGAEEWATDVEIADVYARNVKVIHEQHRVDTAGLRAVAEHYDRAAVLRTLDEIEAKLEGIGYHFDAQPLMLREIRDMRGDQ